MSLLATPKLASVRLPASKPKPVLTFPGLTRVPLKVCRVADPRYGDKHPLYYHHEKMDHDTVMRLRKQRVAEYLEKGWKPDHEMSTRWNVMNVLMMVTFATPLLGLIFAAATYGTLWGTTASTALPM